MKVFQKSLISQVLCDPLLLIPHSCCFVATITVKKGLLRAYKHWVCSHASMAEYMLYQQSIWKPKTYMAQIGQYKTQYLAQFTHASFS